MDGQQPSVASVLPEPSVGLEGRGRVECQVRVTPVKCSHSSGRSETVISGIAEDFLTVRHGDGGRTTDQRTADSIDG